MLLTTNTDCLPTRYAAELKNTDCLPTPHGTSLGVHLLQNRCLAVDKGLIVTHAQSVPFESVFGAINDSATSGDWPVMMISLECNVDVPGR